MMAIGSVRDWVVPHLLTLQPAFYDRTLRWIQAIKGPDLGATFEHLKLSAAPIKRPDLPESYVPFHTIWARPFVAKILALLIQYFKHCSDNHENTFIEYAFSLRFVRYAKRKH